MLNTFPMESRNDSLVISSNEKDKLVNFAFSGELFVVSLKQKLISTLPVSEATTEKLCHVKQFVN